MPKTSSVIAVVGVIILCSAFVLLFIVYKNSSLDPLPPSMSLGLEYKNSEYGFIINMPTKWKGFSTSTSKWIGNSLSGSIEKPFTSGSLISIHNPSWIGENSYQDIPIMIFTIKQWEMQMQGKFYIGAAPIGPSELGRNAKYVFALPARYNYAFPPGYEEVEKILEANKPLKTF